jgi:AcrR family transcriptional regulator
MTDSSVSPRKYARQERSRRTVERILDAAARIFHEQGYAGATTNDIADEADVSIGSLYQYFPNKEAVLLALTSRHIKATTSGLAELLSEQRLEAGVDAILRTVIDFLLAQHELDDLHLLVMHEAPRTRAITLELDRARSHLVEETSQLLAPMIVEETHRALVARMVVATIDASVHDVILRQPNGATRDAAIDLTVTTALTIIASATGQKARRRPRST